MTLSHFGYLAVFLAALTVHSEQTEFTLRGACGKEFDGYKVRAPFALESTIGECDVAEGVCGEIAGHEETFGIAGGTPFNGSGIMVIRNKANRGDYKVLTINGRRGADADSLKGWLSVRQGATTVNQSWTVPFLIGTISPQIPYTIEKQETIIELRGQLGNEPVELQFAEHKDKGGKKFTIKIYPTSKDCAVKNRPVNKTLPSEMQPVNPPANAGNAKPPSEMQPVNPAANAGNAKPPSEMQPANPTANAEYKKPPSVKPPANPTANADDKKPPSVMQPFNQAANAIYNRLPSKDQITSTATYAFSLVPILLVSAWLFAEM